MSGAQGRRGGVRLGLLDEHHLVGDEHRLRERLPGSKRGELLAGVEVLLRFPASFGQLEIVVAEEGDDRRPGVAVRVVAGAAVDDEVDRFAELDVDAGDLSGGLGIEGDPFAKLAAAAAADDRVDAVSDLGRMADRAGNFHFAVELARRCRSNNKESH